MTKPHHVKKTDPPPKVNKQEAPPDVKQLEVTPKDNKTEVPDAQTVQSQQNSRYASARATPNQSKQVSRASYSKDKDTAGTPGQNQAPNEHIVKSTTHEVTYIQTWERGTFPQHLDYCRAPDGTQTDHPVDEQPKQVDGKQGSMTAMSVTIWLLCVAAVLLVLVAIIFTALGFDIY